MKNAEYQRDNMEIHFQLVLEYKSTRIPAGSQQPTNLAEQDDFHESGDRLQGEKQVEGATPRSRSEDSECDLTGC